MDVDALAPSDVWAIGSRFTETEQHAFVAHWNGKGWKGSPIRQRGGLEAVWAASANDVWAVGSDGRDTPLIVHWDGSTWTRVPSGVRSFGRLSGVVGTSANDVWAAGTRFTRPRELLLLHWDGMSWTSVAVPKRPEASFYSLALDPTGGLYLAGDRDSEGAAWHYDSSGLRLLPPVKLGRDSVEALWDIVSFGDGGLWAIGGLGDSIVFRYDGHAWRSETIAPEDALYAIAGTARTDIWAVGRWVEHRDGTTWRTDHKLRNSANLQGITTVSLTEAWAVGYAGLRQDRALIKHYTC